MGIVIDKDAQEKGIVIPVSVGFAGFFSWELIDAATGMVKRRAGPYPNVITDDGLNGVGEEDIRLRDMMQGGFMRVGTGSSTPSESDTSLDSQVESTNNELGDEDGSEDDYTFMRNTWEFEKSEANDNLTELGVARSGVLWTRQLFRDSGGSATTVTKTSDDILRIRYELRLYPDFQDPIKDKEIDVDLRGSPVTTDVEYQPQMFPSVWGSSPNEMFGTLGFWSIVENAQLYEDNTPRTTGAGDPDFSDQGPEDDAPNETAFDDGIVDNYVTDSFEIDVDFTVGVDDGNFPGGIGAIATGANSNNSGSFISFFDPPVDKTDQDELEFTVRFSWGRHTIP